MRPTPRTLSRGAGVPRPGPSLRTQLLRPLLWIWLIGGTLAVFGTFQLARDSLQAHEPSGGLKRVRRRGYQRFLAFMAGVVGQFFKEFGHRGVYEMEIMNPRWSEDPSFVLETIRGHLREGLPAQDPREASRQKREAAEREVLAALRLSPIYPLYRYLLGKAREAMRLREGAKSALVRLVRPARLTALSIGNKLHQKGILEAPEHVFFLTGDELATLLSQQWNGTGIRETIAHRIEQRAEWESLPAPDVLMGDRAVVNLRAGRHEEGFQRVAPGDTQRPRPVGHDGELQGVAVSSGQAEGPARLIHHPGEGHRLKKGDVLVAPSTDPAWTPLFLRAAAVVMEVGGYLSHGAIVAREYGIPAVVNVAGAMTAFREGQELHVDGDSGKVRPIGSVEA